MTNKWDCKHCVECGSGDIKILPGSVGHYHCQNCGQWFFLNYELTISTEIGMKGDIYSPEEMAKILEEEAREE